MRSIFLLAGLAVLVALASFVPAAEARPPVACVSGVGAGTCPGVVCADTNLDGRFGGNECVVIYCVQDGCCWGATCPPPPA
jgi:hypothetical protein